MQGSGGILSVPRVDLRPWGSSSVVCSKPKHLNRSGKGLKSPVDSLLRKRGCVTLIHIRPRVRCKIRAQAIDNPWLAYCSGHDRLGSYIAKRLNLGSYMEQDNH